MQIMPPIGLFKVNQTKSLEQIQEKPRADDFQEALINGVSDYLVNRAKQEIFFSFLEKFEKNYLNKQKLLTDTLFYNFVHLIRNLDERIPSTLQIKHALEEDIKQLPYNLIRRDTTRQRNEGIILLYYNIELIKNLAASKSIEKSFGEFVIDSLDPNTTYTDVEKLLLLTAETFSFIEKYNYIAIYSKLDESSLSRFSRYLGYYLIEKYGLQDKIDNPKILYSHLVTLFQHYHELTLKMHELNSILSSFSPSEDYDGYRNFRKDLTVDIFISATNILIEGLTLLDEFKPKVDQSKPKVDESKSEVDESKSEVDESKPEVDQSKPKVDECKQKVDECKPKVDESKPEVDECKPKVDESKPEVDQSKPKVDQSKSEDTKLKAFEAKRLAQHGVDAYFAFKEGNYLQGINLLSPILFDTTLFTSKTPYLEKEVYEPLLFATEIATAKSSQEVSEIMSRYALPVASYRIKARKNTFMINSYLGASLTHYTTQDIKKKIMNINAPIGLEFSLPRRKCKIIRNISLFAPIIDFGNIISASLDEENDKEVRNPNYEQIFSPGGYLVFGISNDFPLSVGIGYQVNPGRFGFFVGIDMPLFSF
jgi:outer membrane biosynthesis protein TonB